ncbi:CocE/NonD family hydrolase [Nocardia sp. NPDC058519]|uniref:CocE/NonD family hydrolase n=1 Tax=Nocardia sp. NPDC058519 TaxID=3346535 RepID=UPI00365E8C06
MGTSAYLSWSRSVQRRAGWDSMRLFSRRWLAGAVVAATTIAVSALVVPATQAQPDGGAQGVAWTATADGPPLYPGIHIDWDVPITMSDGTVIKANVYRPMDASGRIVETPTPTILNMTPYTKLASMLASSALSIPVLYDLFTTVMNRFDLFNLTGTPFSGIGDLIGVTSGGAARLFSADDKLIKSGYTYIVADIRGTGFSQGTWDMFGERETQDTLEMIDWAANQPWSDGNIGMSGISHSGINQLQAAQQNPPALKAIFPAVGASDLVRSYALPGGAVNPVFTPAWMAAINAGKWLPDLASIFNGTFDWKWLADRAASPATWLVELIQAVFVFSVDAIPPHLAEHLAPNSDLRAGIERSADKIKVPTFLVGGYHDLFGQSQMKSYEQIPLPPGQKRIFMNDGYHVSVGSGAGRPGGPPRLDVLQRAWYDKWLKGIDNGIDEFGPATLFQQGGGWTSGDYPLPGMTHTRQYLSPVPSGTTGIVAHDGSLTPEVPVEKADLTVAPGLSTLCSRDAAQATAGVLAIIDGCAKDSRISEVAALTFTSKAVDAPTLVSGPVAVHLNTVHDVTDGYWSITLNDVAPDGNSKVMTSGQLTASLRAIDEGRSRKSATGDYIDPYQYLTLETRLPTVPGQATTLDIGLTGVHAVLQPGHRLRVDVYASNMPKGLPIPALLIETQLRPQHLLLDPSAPSWVNVPLSRPL